MNVEVRGPDGAIRAITTILVEGFEVDPANIRPTAHFVKDLGFDSLGILELVAEIEQQFGVTVLDEDLGHMVTVSGAADVLMSKLAR